MVPNSVIYQKNTEDSFFRAWVEFLTPFHRLTAREKDVAARILIQYFRFKESISDPEVLRDLLWSRNSKRDIIASLKMSPAHYQMIIAKLKASEFLIDGDINPKYIPSKVPGETRFILAIVFDWSSKNKPVNETKEQA